jgi:death-on-curing protein
VIRGVLNREPRFVSPDEVLTLQETAIDEYGGSPGLRDLGLLESALAMPRQAFGGEFVHEFPFGMAAAYLFHICQNHPFIDGNKRAALATCIVFLRLNGWHLVAPQEAVLEFVLQVAEGTKSKDEIPPWIEAHVRPRPSLELRDFFRHLNYHTLASVFGSISAGAINERTATMLEAALSIPAINEANLGALEAEGKNEDELARILRQHSMLLTAIYRIAEELGYEW